MSAENERVEQCPACGAWNNIVREGICFWCGTDAVLFREARRIPASPEKERS